MYCLSTVSFKLNVVLYGTFIYPYSHDIHIQMDPVSVISYKQIGSVRKDQEYVRTILSYP